MRATLTLFALAGLFTFGACGKKAPPAEPAPATVSPSAETTPGVAPDEPTAPAVAAGEADAAPTPSPDAAAPEPGAEPTPDAAAAEPAHEHADMPPLEQPGSFFRADPGKADSDLITKAVAIMRPTAESKAMGIIKLEAADDGGVKVSAEVEGLPPGKHAFHVHLWGDCTGDDGKSAGTHFNFTGSSLDQDHVDHITGDLGELDADADGKASLEVTVKNASLTGQYSILGRSIIIHEKGNDHTQPPIGAAGGRLACGVIGVAAP